MLGYSSAKAVVDARYTYGNNPSGSSYVLDNLYCDGSESSIFDCERISNGDTEICTISKVAGVRCAMSKLSLI